MDMSKVLLPTVSPVQAAKELRQLTRDTLKHPLTKNTSKLASNLSAIRIRLDKIGSYHLSYLTNRAVTDKQIVNVEAAIATRRSGEGQKALAQLRMNLLSERMQVDEMKRYATRAREVLDLIEELPADLGSDTITISRGTFERINQLAQCFPTNEDIPQGREANIIRAIVAMLRANGVEGIETVTESKGAENVAA